MRFVVFCVAALLAGNDVAGAEQPLVRACDNDHDHPPFRWRQQNADGQMEIHGLGYTLLRQILAKNGWHLELELLPLRRCQQEVAIGKNFQLIITSSPNPERLQRYRVTDAYDETHSHAFYLRSRFPDAAPVREKRDLRKFKVCGIAGHNFAMLDLPAGHIDMGAENYPAVFQMLRSGRCDVVPYSLESIAGLRLVGMDVLGSGDIAYSPIADVEPTPLVMMVAKSYRHGDALVTLINQELAALRQSGELQRLQEAFHRDGNAGEVVPAVQ